MPLHFSRFMPRSTMAALPPYGVRNPQHGSSGAIHLPTPPDAITPYLGIRSRLSQVWINKWTILLLLVLARVLIAIGSLDENMASAKREALQACTSVESMGSTMASMPHYMAHGVNEMTANTVELAVRALMSTLELIVTGVENIIVFVINLLTSTYLCLITLVVRGSVQLALGVVEDTMDFVNKTVGAVGKEISEGVDGFQDKLEDFLSGINSITSVFGGDWEVPELDFSSATDKLQNLQLPSSIDEKLDEINDALPTFDEVKKAANDAIRFPFEEVKKLINQSVGDFKFDRTVMPVPAKEQLSFCSDDDGINSFFDNLKGILSTAQKAFIAVLIVAAVAACIPMGWRELKRWQLMKDHAQLVQQNADDPMDVVYIVSRPYTAKTGLKASKFSPPGRKQILVRWVVAYVTSPPALFVLSLGIAGLFACACQIILLKVVQKEVPALSQQVGAFAEKVVDSLTGISEGWARDANKVIDEVNGDINQDVFGWVNTTTTSVNHTLNVFFDKSNEILDKAFGDTVLRDPVQELLNCLIFNKVEGIQKGLTWVHDHARVDFPGVPTDVFALGASETISNDTSFLANPGEETTDAISSAVLRVIDSLESGIRVEAIISAFIVLIWFIVLLCAVIRVCIVSLRPEKTRGEGGIDAVMRGNASGPDGFTDVPLTAIPPYSNTPHLARCGSGSDGTLGADSASEEYYQAQKLGYAGQRELEVENAHRRKSSYGQMEYSEKR